MPAYNEAMRKSRSGFTIVELLIVIVVIAILAAISIVAYSGIQQRANNTRIISAANQVVKVVSAYIATNGNYPSNVARACLIPADSSCTHVNVSYGADSTLTNNLMTVSTLPSSVPDARPDYNGVYYTYSSLISFNGKPQPALIVYSLRGEEKQCGLANTAQTTGTAGVLVSSTTGWTATSGGYTICYVSITGP